MTEPRCRWDRDEQQYVDPDGETCDVPKREHCQARRSCANHLGWGEQTCARCVGRVRQDIRQIVTRAALMLPEAMELGSVDSEAAAMAGPTCDPEAWSWRKATARAGRAWHVSLDEDDDETNPERVLTTWAQMLSEDYRLPRPDRWDVTNAAAFLERNLNRIAQDEEQDFPQFRREIGRCRSHLEAVMRDSQQPERGVPCPTCVGQGLADPVRVRLVHEYGHWCTDPECCRVHVADESEDRWVCPRDPEHWWRPDAYRNYLEERRGA